MGQQVIYKIMQLLRTTLGILVNGSFTISISIESNRHYNETTEYIIIIYNPIVYIENANNTIPPKDDDP